MFSNRSAPRPLTLPDRISIVGNTGSGKSTLAAQLAELLDCPHVELDALHWGPDWTSAPDDLFRARVRQATSGERWVVDGNYKRVRDVFHDRLQMLVWLDYPLVVNLWRLTRRGLKRIFTREELWESGNRETFGGQFLSSGLALRLGHQDPRHQTQAIPCHDERPRFFPRHGCPPAFAASNPALACRASRRKMTLRIQSTSTLSEVKSVIGASKVILIRKPLTPVRSRDTMLTLTLVDLPVGRIFQTDRQCILNLITEEPPSRMLPRPRTFRP